MGDVIKFPGVTRIDFPAGTILDQAQRADLDSVLVIGRTKDGGAFFASSSADGAEALWLLKHAEHELLEMTSEYVVDSPDPPDPPHGA